MGCGSSSQENSKSTSASATVPTEQRNQDDLVHQQSIQKTGSNSTDINKEIMVRYVQIEKDINLLEARNVAQLLQMKWEELSNLEKQVQRLTSTFEECNQKMLAEQEDVNKMKNGSVKQFFNDQASFEAKLSKEQEEYVAALNHREMAHKELMDVQNLREITRATVKKLHTDADKLQSLYQEQDAILAKLFDGSYGSEQEFKLETEHDACCERQQRISAARSRWQAARLLVFHANSQLAHAVQKWHHIKDMINQNGEARFNLATESRNFLMASCTNLRNAINYLKGVEFPYCKPSEVDTLEKATNNIFSDMASSERHEVAMNVFKPMYQRSRALLKWFDHVIDGTIAKDLKQAEEQLLSKKRELRIERVRLIKEKLILVLGEQAAAEIDEDANFSDSTRMQEQLSNINEEEMKKQLDNVKIIQPDQAVNENENDASIESIMESSEDNASVKDMAPPPSQDEIFGDIDSIKKQYEIDLQEFQRAQDVNRARVEQGLQEKLAARKSRKARILAEQQKLIQDTDKQ